MTTPASGKDELKHQVNMYVESAYLHGLPVENLDTDELEAPRDVSDVAWITEKLMHLIATSNQQAVQKALKSFEKAMIAKFDELCEGVRTDPYLGNSTKGKKDNFLDGAEVMLTEAQFQASALAATQPQKDERSGA